MKTQRSYKCSSTLVTPFVTSTTIKTKHLSNLLWQPERIAMPSLKFHVVVGTFVLQGCPIKCTYVVLTQTTHILKIYTTASN